MQAAKNGHLPVVEYLLERGADTEAKDEHVNYVVISCENTPSSHVHPLFRMV